MISNMTNSAWHQIPNITKQGTSAVVQTSHIATYQIVGAVAGFGVLAVAGYFLYSWWKKQQNTFRLVIFDDKKNFKIVEKKLEGNKFFSHDGNKYFFVEDAVFYLNKSKPYLFYKRGVSMPLILQDKKKLSYFEDAKLLKDAVDTKILSEFLTLRSNRSNLFGGLDTQKLIIIIVVAIAGLYVVWKMMNGGGLI